MSIKHKLNYFLKRFNIQVHGIGYLQSLSKGEFKKNEFDFFKETFLGKSIVIFDVGANRGSTVQKFIDFFPSSSILAFEPINSLCETMQHLFKMNKNIQIENCGISDINGELTFYINKSIDTSSFLPSQKTGLNSDAQVRNTHQLTVPVKTIEQSCKEKNIKHINILKLDIQGSEMKALAGSANLLKQKSIDVIYTEAYFIQQYVGQPLFAEIALYLSTFGYQLQDIYNPIYGKGKIAWCDAVFIRDDL